EAISQPTRAITSITTSRGKNRATSRIMSCIACVSSLTIISRIFASLSAIANLEQIRLQSLELRAESFDVCFHHFARCISILRKETKNSAPIEGCQRLHDVVAPDHRLLLCGAKFIDGIDPVTLILTNLV